MKCIYNSIYSDNYEYFFICVFWMYDRCGSQVVDEAFETYYASFVPGIKNILCMPNVPTYNRLKGKAMECIGLIGEAVGETIFRNDAPDIMRILLLFVVGGTFYDLLTYLGDSYT